MKLTTNYAQRIRQFIKKHDIERWNVSFIKSTAWVLVVTIIGLLQLLLILLSGIIKGTPDESLENKILSDGVLIFFDATLAASITIDYFFSSSINSKLKKMSRLLSTVLFIGLPLLLFFASVVLFLSSPEDITKIVISRVKFLQSVMTIAVIFHAWVSKTLFFYLE